MEPAQPNGRTAPRSLRPLHPPTFVSVCCRKMFSSFEPMSVFVLPWIEEVPFGANFVLGCFAHIAACSRQLSSLPVTVDFPRRCPLPRIHPCSLWEGGVRRYKPILQIALPRFCPERLSAKVPNRGVDWSSRPRRACYPWGNFSVTSSPQQ